MRLATLGRFLLGRRDAILEVAQSRHALLIGFLFVLSAGFAREYDGESILHEPWHWAIPLVGSFVTSVALWTLVWVASARGGQERPGWGEGYIPFLRCFWMTAPLAWIYAFPIERLASPVVAVEFNLWLLAIVAAWRVVLMIQVIRVLWNAHVVPVTLLVLLFGDVVVLVALQFSPLPLLVVMGGLRLDAASSLLMGVRFMTFLVVFLAVWPLALAALATIAARKEWTWTPAGATPVPSASRGALALACGSLLLGAVLMPFAQPAQYRRMEVDRLLRDERINEGIDLMAQHERADYPPHWSPPPRAASGIWSPDIVDVVEALAARPAAP
ncbi:MAG: hypothetical protein ACYTGX_14220, partial [Planctomycetota bacterium]